MPHDIEIYYPPGTDELHQAVIIERIQQYLRRVTYEQYIERMQQVANDQSSEEAIRTEDIVAAIPFHDQSPSELVAEFATFLARRSGEIEEEKEKQADQALKAQFHGVGPDVDFKQFDADNTEGFCYAFALIQSAMHKMGKEKQEWWHAVLTQMRDMDFNDPEALDRKVVLPGKSSEEAVSLREIFDVAINHIAFNMAMADRLGGVIFEENYTQKDFIGASGVFDYVDDEGIHDVKSVDYYIQHFTKEELKQFLEKNKSALSDNICLVGSRVHACSLYYDTDSEHWFFYDPNARDGEWAALDSAEEMAQALISTDYLGADLIFRVLACDDNNTALVKPVFKSSHMDGNAIFLHLKYNPSAIRLGVLATDYPELAIEPLVGKLELCDSVGQSALALMVKSSDKLLLDKIIELAGNGRGRNERAEEAAKQLRQSIASALMKNDENGVNIMHLLVTQRPEMFSSFMEMAAKPVVGDGLRNAMAAALLQSCHGNSTPFRSLDLVVDFPDRLDAVVKLALVVPQNEALTTLLVREVTAYVKAGHEVLLYELCQNQGQMNNFLKLLEAPEAGELKGIFIDILTRRDLSYKADDGSTVVLEKSLLQHVKESHSDRTIDRMEAVILSDPEQARMWREFTAEHTRQMGWLKSGSSMHKAMHARDRREAVHTMPEVIDWLQRKGCENAKHKERRTARIVREMDGVTAAARDVPGLRA